MYTCKICKVDKPETEYYGRQRRCKKCQNQIMKEHQRPKKRETVPAKWACLALDYYKNNSMSITRYCQEKNINYTSLHRWIKIIEHQLTVQ